MEDRIQLYEDVRRKQYDRYLRREARRQWEEQRPHRIAGYVVQVAGIGFGCLLCYWSWFFMALWASM